MLANRLNCFGCFRLWSFSNNQRKLTCFCMFWISKVDNFLFKCLFEVIFFFPYIFHLYPIVSLYVQYSVVRVSHSIVRFSIGCRSEAGFVRLSLWCRSSTVWTWLCYSFFCIIHVPLDISRIIMIKKTKWLSQTNISSTNLLICNIFNVKQRIFESWLFNGHYSYVNMVLFL